MSNERPVQLSLSAARRLALYCQGLDGAWDLPAGKEGVAQSIERLGYVQIDTIAVVQRAHHHTLWTRRADYAPAMLHDLQATDRRVFEYWTHAASYIPMAHYRFYLPPMRARRDSKRVRTWLRDNARLVEEVRRRIRHEGALASADFEAPEGFQRGSWWSRKPAKQALEVLFDIGELMVSERRNFQRLYDLRERVLPPDVDTREPEPQELGRFVVRQALATLGVATSRQLLWRQRSKGLVSQALDELLAAGEVLPVTVEGQEESYYGLKRLLEGAAQRQAPPQVHLLSPFDNLIIARQRLAELFGFEYTLESYTPAAKRRYGYYCLPILWGERFVGRLDPKAERKKKTLLLRSVLLDADVAREERFLAALRSKLWALARFNGCERLVVEHAEPAIALT